MNFIRANVAYDSLKVETKQVALRGHAQKWHKIAKFTFFAKYRKFEPSLQQNQKYNGEMAWYSCSSTYKETTTKKTCPLEVRCGLQDEPKSRALGPGYPAH